MYNLEIEKAVNAIKTQKAKTILLQLPDGLKPKAKQIQQELKKHTNSEILIWAASCFGACDIPKIQNIDLNIQWGHAQWK